MPDPSETLFRQRDAEKRYVLQKHRFFGNFSPEHIERLASCIVAKSVTRATTIFAKGDPGSSLFAICKGSVKITRSSVDGHDAIFNLIGEGAIFGEIALLDGRPRTADAIATTDCQLFVIERRDFLPLLREEPEIALKLIEILCDRLRQTTDQAESAMFEHLPGRLAKVLLHLSEGQGEVGGRKVLVTQKDLGSLIGMARETINRELKTWEQNRWVRLERGEIIILSTKDLERVAESDSE